jgi:hypothetical protein
LALSASVFRNPPEYLANADGQDLLYFEKIQNTKQQHYLPNDTSQDVGGIPARAIKIPELLQTLI